MLVTCHVRNDSRGFGAEGDWKTAMLVRIANVMARAGLVVRASWRTTRITWSRVRSSR